MKSIFQATKFFILRTPLLPLNTFLALTDSHNSTESNEEGFRHVVGKLLENQIVVEALWLASPDLIDQLRYWNHPAASPKRRRVESTLYRYFTRMSCRSTPFGLFSGCSLGTINGGPTSLEVCRPDSYKRHTRLDAEFLHSICSHILRNSECRKSIKLYPNTTIYPTPSHFHFVTAEQYGAGQSFVLKAVQKTDYLEQILAWSIDGTTLEDLADTLVTGDSEIGKEDAVEYIDELIVCGILVPKLIPTVSGSDPTEQLLTTLEEVEHAGDIRAELCRIRSLLAALDTSPLGNNLSGYEDIVKSATKTEAPFIRNHLLQADLYKPAPSLALAQGLVDQLTSIIPVLQRMRPDLPSPLNKFREQFKTRYGMREMPLLQVLNDETGIGFEKSDNAQLEGLAFPQNLHSVNQESATSFTQRDQILLNLLIHTVESGQQEIALTSSDENKLITASRSRLPLPDSLAAVASLHGDGSSAPHKWHLHYVTGPSGARILGRFCGLDEQLQSLVSQYVHEEEHDDGIYCEIVHLPFPRAGNVLLRPHLREYELPVLCHSSKPRNKQILLTDLLISIEQDEIVLRSSRLQKRVFPRLTNSHAYTAAYNLKLYKFLALLQTQGVTPIVSWDWGVLKGASFLPRIALRGVIVSRSQWVLTREDCDLSQGSIRQRENIEELRKRLKLPRFVNLVEGDNELLFDLESSVSIDTFHTMIRGKSGATLVECLEHLEHQATGSKLEQRFANQIIVPLQLKTSARPITAHKRFATYLDCQERSLLPGSNLCYFKIYCSPSQVDDLLSTVVSPAIESLRLAGRLKQWFFVRYADPEWHLRLRLFLQDGCDALVLQMFNHEIRERVGCGLVQRFQLDTYDRELERYGGLQGVVAAERLFECDSDAAIDILRDLENHDAGPDVRWKAALLGVDALLDDFDYSLENKRRLMEIAVKGYELAGNADSLRRRQIAQIYRTERLLLREYLSVSAAGAHAARIRSIFDARSPRIANVASILRMLDVERSLSRSIDQMVLSYIHMSINRLLKNDHMGQECSMYQMLEWEYESQIARGAAMAESSGDRSTLRAQVSA